MFTELILLNIPFLNVNKKSKNTLFTRYFIKKIAALTGLILNN